jgi:hypothetical protein
MNSDRGNKVRCPACGGRDVRRSQRRGVFDAFMGMLHRIPHRCRGCRHRFFLHQTQALPEPAAAPGNEKKS